MTGGKFFEAADQDALETVYDEIGSQVGVDEEQRELTVLFTAAGAVLLLLGGALDALVRPHSLSSAPPARLAGIAQLFDADCGSQLAADRMLAAAQAR